MTMLAVAVGVLTGIISGFGIGGGTLLLLYLTAVAGVEQYAASGINLLYFLCCAPTALISHIRHKRVVWQAFIWCAVAGVITSIVAALVAPMLPTQLLRQLFGMLLLYVGCKELFFKSKKEEKSPKKDR